jgi:hypothetical protein
MSWTRIDFKPVDVLVNSDARSDWPGGFAPGGRIWPGAFAGLLRTAILREHGFDEGTDAVVGFSRLDFSFRFRGPFHTSPNGLPLFPMPRDRQQTRSALGTPRADRLHPDETIVSDAPVTLLRGQPNGELDDRLVIPAHLAYLLAEAARGTARARAAWEDGVAGGVFGRSNPISDVVSGERRYGHKRRASGVPEDGALFSRATWRFRESRDGMKAAGFCGLLDAHSGTLLPGPILSRLGGDGHLTAATLESSFEKGSLAPLLALTDLVCRHVEETGRFCLYLATPAIFSAGWAPTLTTSTGSALEARLVAAAVGKPEIIGGWSMAKGRSRPKPLRRATPAGSIYYFTVDAANRPEVANLIETRYGFPGSISDLDAELGLGVCVPGVW